MLVGLVTLDLGEYSRFHAISFLAPRRGLTASQAESPLIDDRTNASHERSQSGDRPRVPMKIREIALGAEHPAHARERLVSPALPLTETASASARGCVTLRG